jgi:multidrug resistance efflux pump
MAGGRRYFPGLGWVGAVLLLVAPVGVAAWWLKQPKADPTPAGPPLAELDVVCLGRVDGLAPVASLDPAVAGRIEWVIEEGAAVQARQPLLRLDAAAARLRVKEADAAITAAEVEVQAAKADAELHPLRKAAQAAAVKAAGERVAAAEELLKQRKSQQSFNMVTAAELFAAEAEVRQLQQLEIAEKARLQELEATTPQLRVRAAEARKATAEVAREQAAKAVEDCVLVAPSEGVVLRVQASPGEAVVPGGPNPPIVFRPGGPLVVRAELEQEFLGRVRPGMPASIRDEARADSPTWPGRVLRVGNWVARRRSVVLEPGEANDVRTVECVIGLDPAPVGPLLVGQRVRVRIGRAD